MISFEEVKELAKNSPFLLLILLVLWQYRRDYLKVIKQTEHHSTEFIDLLRENVEALISNREATKENTATINRYFNENPRIQRGRRPRDREDPL